jgi:asparagine synthase (glutamine-hydrolysing)
VKTFTVGFEEQDYDERPWAREVADRYRTTHTERLVRADDVADVFRDTILWHYDEPFNDYSYLPTYYVCREARKSITVALSGDGGDELFAGYRKYRRLAIRARLERTLSRPVTQLVAAGAQSILQPDNAWRERLGRYREGAPELLLSTMTAPPGIAALRAVARGRFAEALSDYEPMDVVRPLLQAAPPEDVGLVNSMRYLDFKLTLGAGILTKVDRASMAVSLEVRPVYLHRELLRLAGQMPPALLVDRRETKKVVKSAVRGWLPSSVIDRPKMGFAMPLGRWLRGDLQRLERPAVGTGALGEIIDIDYVRSVARAHRSGAAESTAAVHSFLFLEHWLEKWL